jgi:hypothetical protein
MRKIMFEHSELYISRNVAPILTSPLIIPYDYSNPNWSYCGYGHEKTGDGKRWP